ncbi:hypothetical protein C0J52_16299 [Blattella germanica]|nr:hypothetical protein C0J52_16299 [Blattella germanica]
MGARQSKRSVDITTTPKKEGVEEPQQALDGKLGHIEEGTGDSKPAANGAPHTAETQVSGHLEQKSKLSNSADEVIHNGSEPVVDGEVETAQTPDAETVIAEEKDKNEEENNKVKKEKKEKVKKKWSFRSISFSKKDKSKPPREDKNGDVTKEEVAEVSILKFLYNVCSIGNISRSHINHLKVMCTLIHVLTSLSPNHILPYLYL